MQQHDEIAQYGLSLAPNTIGKNAGVTAQFHVIALTVRENLERFDEYQRLSRRTWNAVNTDHPIVYPTLGLVNEAGELAGKVKKIFRDKGGAISEADRQALKHELGDVLWYLTQLATELDISLDEVAQANIDKLASRMERDQIRGEGDDR